MRAHGAVTGHGGEELLLVLANAVAAAILHEIGKHIAQQPFRIVARQQRRQRPNHQSSRSGTIHHEAHGAY